MMVNLARDSFIQSATNMFFRHLFNFGVPILFFCFSMSAYALEQKSSSAKAAFMSFTVTLGEEDIPYSDTSWKVVRAEDNLNAFSSKEVLLRGVTDAKGTTPLSVEQRKKLYAAWEAMPNNIWLVYGLRALKFSVKNDNGYYQIKMLWRVEDDVIPLEGGNNLNELEKLPPSTYTQPGFKSEEFYNDLLDWRRRFQSDLKSFQGEMKRNPDFGKTLLVPQNEEALKNTFANSIDTGEKGLSLRKMIISAAYSQDRRVWSPGKTLVRLIDSPHLKPVGYGGKFDDSGRSVELWYIVFDDLSKWMRRDLNESPVYSVFKPLELPANGVVKRNSWPTFVFIRNQDSKPKMYALSAETSSIIAAVFKAQIR